VLKHRINNFTMLENLHSHEPHGVIKKQIFFVFYVDIERGWAHIKDTRQ